MRKPLFPLLLILLLLVAGACTTATQKATGTALIAAGSTLDGLGNHYVNAAQVFNRGCDITKTIDAASCTKFRAFGLRFRVDYPKAVEGYKAAVRANDAAGAHNAIVVATQLATELAALALSGGAK